MYKIFAKRYRNFLKALPGAWLSVETILEVFQAFQSQKIYQGEYQNNLRKERKQVRSCPCNKRNLPQEILG